MTGEKSEGQAKYLPFDGVGFEKQIEILRAFATFYLENKKAAKYSDISPLVGISASNVSSCLKFWRSTNLLQGQRRLSPSRGLLDFARTDSENEWRILGIAIMDTWFVSAVRMRFSLKDSLTEEEIAETLAKTYNPLKSSKASRKSIAILVSLLTITEIIVKQDHNYVLGRIVDEDKSQEGGAKELAIQDDNNLIQIRIGDALYAIDRQILADFVKSHGTTLSRETILE
ncbi:MAG: hypothetical protein ACFFFC_14205 [Candidatus Thorarchaeota archaeon]